MTGLLKHLPWPILFTLITVAFLLQVSITPTSPGITLNHHTRFYAKTYFSHVGMALDFALVVACANNFSCLSLKCRHDFASNVLVSVHT